MSAEHPTFNQLNEQLISKDRSATVLIERTGDTISTGRYLGEKKGDKYVVEVTKDGKEAYKLVDAAEITDERQAELAETLFSSAIRQELGHAAMVGIVSVEAEPQLLAAAEAKESDRDPRYERIFKPIERPAEEKGRESKNRFADMLSASDEEAEQRSKQYLADMSNGNSILSRQRIYDSYITEGSQRVSADYLRRTLSADWEFASMFDTKDFRGKPAEEISEALRTDPDLRYKAGVYLLEKLELDLIRDPSRYPERIVMNTGKTPNGFLESVGNIKSREYVALLALAKLDGTFNNDRAADGIFYDQRGIAKQGQHRSAADTLLNS